MVLKRDAVLSLVRTEIVSKVKQLLEQKHLYQKVEIEVESIYQEIAGSDVSPAQSVSAPLMRGPLTTSGDLKRITRDEFKSSVRNIVESPWEFEVETNREPWDPKIARNAERVFELPTIQIACNHCPAVLPAHNSGCVESKSYLKAYNLKGNPLEKKQVQIFQFPYQCQSCRGEALVFLVRREGFRLQLVGRSQFEKIDIPKCIPKEEADYFSEAKVAHSAGRVLASLFFLRTLLEQYLRRILGTKGRMSGEELASRYAAKLDDEFPKKFTSLKTIYGELSEKLHSADADEKQVEKSLKDIQKHFELLQQIPLKTD